MQSDWLAASMRTMAMVALVAVLASVSVDAKACRTDPPMQSPDYGDLARTSNLIAIVRIERIRPLSLEDEAFIEQLFSGNAPTDAPVRLPTASAEFSTVRVLKGQLPGQSLIQNGATNCDVYFLEGKDYLVFAQRSNLAGEIVPSYGTFPIDQSQHGLATLAEVESSLNSPNPKRP